MTKLETITDAASAFDRAYVKMIEQSVVLLLQERHLYQSVSVQVEELEHSMLPVIGDKARTFMMVYMSSARECPWILEGDDSLQSAIVALSSKSESQQRVTWKAPDIKIFCATCDRIEPYNRVGGLNLLARGDMSNGGLFVGKKRIQVYALSYLCQSCKSVPEVFLIRRVGSKLTSCGRAPIERVHVPKHIPKEIAKYYSNSVIAYQSGQTLSALFMLRTLCEQWVRRFSEVSDKADVAIEKYMQTLPADFNARFASFRTIYSDLSLAIHSADESQSLYESSIEMVSEHFEARKLFRL